MARKELKNKPLVEAIFDLRWELQDLQSGVKVDPHYKLLIGGLYDRLRTEYPFHEQLPAATMPDELAGYVVQHRFRKEENGWPLVQIGPGVLTLNDTDGYTWDDFEKRIEQALGALFEAYPESGGLRVSEVLLRYIDAIRFDYTSDEIFDFLNAKMKTTLGLHRVLFEGTGVGNEPLALDLRLSFASVKPKGALQLRIARGKYKDQDGLIWETMLRSAGEDAPETTADIKIWAQQAHELTVYGWFFKIIEGDLEKEFSR